MSGTTMKTAAELRDEIREIEQDLKNAGQDNTSDNTLQDKLDDLRKQLEEAEQANTSSARP